MRQKYPIIPIDTTSILTKKYNRGALKKKFKQFDVIRFEYKGIFTNISIVIAFIRSFGVSRLHFTDLIELGGRTDNHIRIRHSIKYAVISKIEKYNNLDGKFKYFWKASKTYTPLRDALNPKFLTHPDRLVRKWVYLNLHRLK